MSKDCAGCKKTLPIEQFGRNSKAILGYSNKCRVCTNKEAKINRDRRKSGDVKPRRGFRVNNLIGQRFHSLTVIERDYTNTRNTKWKCVCDCGASHSITTEKLKARTYEGCKVCKVSKGWKNSHGYRLVPAPDHPRAHKNTGMAYEHILVMEAFLGRHLVDKENVHHVNGMRDDNRIENLELWNTGQPAGQRIEDKVKWAIELLRQYHPEMLTTQIPDITN